MRMRENIYNFHSKQFKTTFSSCIYFQFLPYILSFLVFFYSFITNTWLLFAHRHHCIKTLFSTMSISYLICILIKPAPFINKNNMLGCNCRINVQKIGTWVVLEKINVMLYVDNITSIIYRNEEVDIRKAWNDLLLLSTQQALTQLVRHCRGTSAFRRVT